MLYNPYYFYFLRYTQLYFFCSKNTSLDGIVCDSKNTVSNKTADEAKITSSAHTLRAPLTEPASYAANILSPRHPAPSLSAPPAPRSEASGYGPAPRKSLPLL